MAGDRLSGLFSHVCGLALRKILSRPNLGCSVPHLVLPGSWACPCPSQPFPLTCRGVLLSPVCLNVIPFLRRSWNPHLNCGMQGLPCLGEHLLFRTPVGGVQGLERSFWTAPPPKWHHALHKAVLVMKLENSQDHLAGKAPLGLPPGRPTPAHVRSPKS